MKTHRITFSVLTVIFFCFKNSLLIGISPPKVAVKLKFVFTAQVDSTNKDVLKLYDDKTYEYLVFQMVKSKPKVKREKGTYSFKGKKLVLNVQSKNPAKDHPFHFTFIENKGLIKSQLFNHSNKENPLLYILNNDSIFWLPTYHDNVFGNITNDKKVTKKIIEDKPDYNPVAVKPEIQQTFIEPFYPTVRQSPPQISLGKKYLSRDSLSMLKAVIIVGPVGREWDETSIKNQMKNADYLRSIGVQVFEFYPPNDNWNSIVKACEGAHIFIYSGHGSNQGINYNSGGLCLTDRIHSAQEILDQFKLHKNAIVLFNSVCMAAGSSASDNSDIGKHEAIKRVSEYAYPFYKLKAGAYYANNYEGCIIPFFESFFKRKNIKSIYKTQASLWQKIEEFRKYPYDSKFEVAVASRPGTNQIVTRYSSSNDGPNKEEKIKDCKSYDVAYVGKPNLTVRDLFK